MESTLFKNDVLESMFVEVMLDNPPVLPHGPRVEAPILAVERLNKSFQFAQSRVHVLKNINLFIYPGEFLALSGPSGSGKTTLLNILGGIETSDSGFIQLDGERLDGRSQKDLAEIRANKLAFIFQTFNLIPVLTAFENVEYPLYKKNVSRKMRNERVHYALDKVGLSDFLNRRPGELSGGQRQRVAIARALVVEPLLILADEPTANLDPATAREILGLMKDLNRRLGTTFVFSTHDSNVMQLASRILRLADGTIEPSA